MDHNAIKDQLFALYDGELDAPVKKEVESHLAGCMECRELYQNWAKTAKVVFKTAKPEASEFFVHRVMERVHALETSRPGFDWKQKVSWNISLPWLVPVVGLAAMLLLAPVSSLPYLSTETLLTGGAVDTASQWMFSKEPLKSDEVLGFVMEEAS